MGGGAQRVLEVVRIELSALVSTAMISSGAAGRLAGLFVFTVTLGHLVTNVATALIVIPVAVSASAEMDVSAKRALMTVAVSAAASFMTPVATPANLMVMEPGGYRFGDYWRLGLPLLALFGVVAIGVVPVFWPL
jgi:di/tricarboxylate transporter